MTTPEPRPAAGPSRLSLIPPALAILLGTGALVSHLRQPRIPTLPGRGCLITTFDSPETRFIPRPRVDLEACVHISETLFYLNYYAAPDAGPSVVFEASGPEGPEQWRDHFRITWTRADTLVVSYDSAIEVQHASAETNGLHLTYRRVPHP